MTAPVTANERDLRTLAGIVSEHRADLPAEGLPPSLLADLMGQIRCDEVTFAGFDSTRRETWFAQTIPALDDTGDPLDQEHWSHYWDCNPGSYPRPQRRPAHHHQDRGLLFSQAMAWHRHVQRLLPAVGAGT